MLDRASTFAHPEIVKMLQNDFVPVAIDQAYQRRQKDREGEFYREIALQGPRHDFEGSTTQGFYAATNSGTLLFYNNNRDPEKLAELMEEALKKAASEKKSAVPISMDAPDPQYNPEPPDGGLVVRVHSKILHGYPETTDRWKKIFQEGIGRDNFWITAAEHRELVAGRVPATLQRRMVRFHFVDNTRGEPPMWEPEEIGSLSTELKDGILTGSVELRTAKGDRSYSAQLYGVVETSGEKVTRLDVVARGLFEGHGEYTKGPPPGKFPLAISFSLADGSDMADRIPPQGSRGWVENYLQ